jgi:plastocyanin
MARLDDKLELGADLTSDSTESSTDRILRPNRRTILGGAAALIVAGLGASNGVLAHGGDDDDEDDHDNSGPGGGGHDDNDDDHHGLPPEQSTQVTDVTTVRIVDERFEPNNILIETGQTVTWENRDDDQHSASGRGMDTGVINPGGKGTVTFLDPGEFQYTCNFHPEMLGLVTVTGESKATPQATPQASPVAAPMEMDVKIVDFAFDSDKATLAVGGTVTWTNTGQTPHTILASWATSDLLNPGDSFQHRFDTVGTFEYQCGLHPAMVGTIEVVAAVSASPESSPSTPATA